MDIGALIRDVRRTARLSQSELAALSGTSQATLSAYERNRKVPSAATLARLVAATGMRLTAQPASRPILTPTGAQLEERGRVLAQVLDLAERLPARHSRTLRFPPLRPRPTNR